MKRKKGRKIFFEKSFDNINRWLSHAEAKNAANIAFVVAIIAAIFSLDAAGILVVLSISAFLASGIISIFSFWPHTAKVRKKHDEKKDIDNLIYFGDICHYTGSEYVRAVEKKYFGGAEEGKMDQYEKDLADEIVYNSSVAMWKYKIFKMSICFDMAGMFILLIKIVLAKNGYF